MPEGPSIVILRDAAAPFVGQTIIKADGNSRLLDFAALQGKPVLALRSWGKHFLIQLPDRSIKIHFMMFGSYRINDPKDAAPRLRLRFEDGEMDFYACSVREIGQDLDAIYDWRTDVMSAQWDPRLARKRLREQPQTLACDALLDQSIFSGVGNIIKNEVLFRIRLHPVSQVGALSPRKLGELVEQARTYSFDFLAWKRDYVLRAHWLAHTRQTCPRCHIPFHKGKLGRTQRRSFFCERCQKRYVMDT